MLPCLSNRSQKEVWFDFLSRFGQNCNTNRDRERGGDIIILPGGLDINSTLKKLGRLRGERYLLLINHFYFRGIYRKKSKKEAGNFLASSRDTLVEIGGNRYLQLIQHGIDEGQIIKSPRGYVIGSQSNEYMLDSKLLDFSIQQTYALTVKAASKIWVTRPTKRKKAFIKNSVARAKIADGVDGLRFNYSAAFDFVAEITDPEHQAHRVAVLSQLITDGQMWATDKQQRNYTTIVTIPSELRRFFTYKGQDLCVIDINSSQPLLHSLLYPDNEPEKEKYLEVVRTGFWDYMNDITGEKYDLSDDEEKNLLKDKIWPQVFFGKVQTPWWGKGEYATAFKNSFPVLWEEIKKAKTEKYEDLSKAMQSIEATGVMGVVAKLAKKPYPLITIHDAIVTTKENAIEVGLAIRAEFDKLGLKPKLSFKELKS